MILSSRIRHHIVEAADRIESIVGRLHVQGPDRTRKLFDLGAIYLNKRRVFADAGVLPGDYLRIHTEPRRYRLPARLSTRVLHQDANFIVFDKPGGVPCHATLDNGVENMIGWWEQETGEKLFITSRIDVPTSGCLVLARSPLAASRWNRLLLKDFVRKEYEAIVEGEFPFESGEIVHWMEKENWAPRKVRAEEFPDALECRLEVLSRAIEGTHSRLRLRLITGRTHQIRAQTAALGHPVLNDEMYGACRVNPRERIALCARRLSYRDPFDGAFRELTAFSGPDEDLG